MSDSKFAILASGTGSNALSIINHSKENNLPFSCLITDNPNSPLNQKIDTLEIEGLCLEFSSKTDFENELVRVLKEKEIKWIFLAGFMRILSGEFLKHFYDQELGLCRVINIHPSLLPSFKGLDAYRQSFQAGVHLYGHSIHFVNERIDDGVLISQYPLIRAMDDSFEDYQRRGLFAENQNYPQVVEKIVNGKFKILREGDSSLCFLS